MVDPVKIFFGLMTVSDLRMPRKAKSQPAQLSQRMKLIEEFATLDQEIELLKPKLSRHQMLRSLILDWHAGAAAEEEITIPGVTCDIVVTARDRVRAVTQAGKLKLYRLWGAKDFIAKAIVLLKSLPDPEDGGGLYTVRAMTGPRHLRVVAKARPAADTAA